MKKFIKNPFALIISAIVLFFGGLIMIVTFAFMSAISIDQMEQQQQTNPCSSNSSSSAAPTTLTGNGNIQQTWNFFSQLGFVPAPTAGIMGNAAVESAGTFSPTERQFGGPGVGIFQWTFDQRWQSLLKYASTEGVSPYDLKTQLSFAWNEMQQRNLTPQTMNNMSVANATGTFELRFEGAGDPHEDVRVSYAQQFYNQFSGMKTAAPTNLTSQQTVITNTCTPTGVSGNAAAIVKTAESFVGKVTYVFGGGRTMAQAKQNIFDCSSFSWWVYHLNGIDLGPQTDVSTKTIAKLGKPETLSSIRPGDLIEFNSDHQHDGHVGIYIGNGQMVNAEDPANGCKIASIQVFIKDYGLGDIRRILN